MERSETSKNFGRQLWSVMHRIAAAYPVNQDMSRSEKMAWGSKYLVFYKSLQYVLPFQQWRNNYFTAITTGRGRLDDEEIAKINESKSPRKAFAKKVFQIHDAVRQKLNQPIAKGTYDALFAKYSKWGAQNQDTRVPKDAQAISLLMDMLSERDDAMDDYLRKHVTGYNSMGAYRKKQLRPDYLRDAAIWWWERLAKPYVQEPNGRRRKLVLAIFDKRFQRKRHVVRNFVRNIKAIAPGAK